MNHVPRGPGGGRTIVLRSGEAFTVPAGVVHRSRSQERSVNLCFENLGAYTDVVFVDEPVREGPSSGVQLEDDKFHPTKKGVKVQNVAAKEKSSTQLFRMEPKIRYVAVNQKGRIVEMEQSPSHPTYNPHESDRMEELIVNPIVLELAARRGNLDMDGIRYLVIRYGTQYQLLMPYGERHLSICVELQDDPVEVASKITAALKLRP